MTSTLPPLAPLDDQALLAELPRLARSERAATVALVARLAELDTRRARSGTSRTPAFIPGPRSLSFFPVEWLSLDPQPGGSPSKRWRRQAVRRPAHGLQQPARD